MKFSIVKNFYNNSDSIEQTIKNEMTKQGMEFDEQNPDYVFVVGGDGTFLTAVSKYNDQLDKVKLIPVNNGTLGFFTSGNEFNGDIKSLKENDFDLLEVTIKDIDSKANNDTFYVANEIKIMNDKLPVHLDVLVNNQELEHVSGTGLIVSTAMGSTGVMKSSQGAVIYPTSGLYEMQEVASVETNMIRTINAPIIFSKDQSLTINKAKPIQKAELIIDSKIVIEDFKSLTIKLSDKKVKVLTSADNNRAKQLKDTFTINKY